MRLFILLIIMSPVIRAVKTPLFAFLSLTFKAWISSESYSTLWIASSRSMLKSTAGSLALALFGYVQPHGFVNERYERCFIHIVTFVEVNGAHRFAIQALIEELLRIHYLSALGEGQPHGVLEYISCAQYSSMRPNRDTQWIGRFFPLHFFEHSRVGLLD